LTKEQKELNEENNLHSTTGAETVIQPYTKE
jgi:hypothetical protein